MARLDVYRSPEKNVAGYLLDVQSVKIDRLRTRVVVPLLPVQDAPSPISDLNPVFDVMGTPHVLATQFIFTVDTRELRAAVVSLHDRQDEVTRALDTLLSEY